MPIKQTVKGLKAGVTYYYRIVGRNSENSIPQRGAILSFDTLPNALPVVTLLGATDLSIEAAASYVDAGATASDTEDGILSPTISSNTVVSDVPGVYAVTWSVFDSLSAEGSATVP